MTKGAAYETSYCRRGLFGVHAYPTILGRQAHAVKQNAIQHLGIGRNIPEPLVREQHLRNSIECE